MKELLIMKGNAMILADKILNLRKKNGYSQEDLARKLGVSRQSISKWEGAQAIPDIDRIIQMSQIFGVTTDYLIKDHLEIEEHVNEDLFDSALRRVSLSEAAEFLRLKDASAPKVAIAVLLFILSPLVLLFLLGLVGAQRINLAEEAALAIGLTVLIFTVVVGIVIVFLGTQDLSKFAYLEHDQFETEYGVEGMVRQRREQLRGRRIRNQISGVVLLVISPLWVIVPSLIYRTDEFAIFAGICALLVNAAIGVFLLVTVGVIEGAHEQLLQDGDYTYEKKRSARVVQPFAGVYWILVTVIYFVLSFVYHSWNISWLVWPIAGLIFAVIVIILEAIFGRKPVN
ncbi:helix-turn-helix transcriptional regulator [Arcanobacterium hippocoleae]